MTNIVPPDDGFLQLLKNYQKVEIIQNTRGRNNRFQYAKAHNGEIDVFLKYAPTVELEAGLQRELKWASFMDFVSKTQPESGLSGPQNMRLVQDNLLEMKFIHAPELADYHSLASWRDNLTRFVAMLHAFDMAAATWQGDGRPNQKQRDVRYYDIWCEWLGEKKELVPRLEEARQRVEETQPATYSCMQHGDLRPWQIFSDNNHWIVYDGEASGEDLLRYNDLAYGYGRIYTNLRSPDTAQNFLQEFMRVAAVDKREFLQQLTPVMIGRAVGMVSDSLNDADRNDYRKEAFELLDICLDEPDKLAK